MLNTWLLSDKYLVNLIDEERCLLDILLSLKDDENNAFTKEELKNHVLTFMSAGHEVCIRFIYWYDKYLICMIIYDEIFILLDNWIIHEDYSFSSVLDFICVS